MAVSEKEPFLDFPSFACPEHSEGSGGVGEVEGVASTVSISERTLRSPYCVRCLCLMCMRFYPT